MRPLRAIIYAAALFFILASTPVPMAVALLTVGSVALLFAGQGRFGPWSLAIAWIVTGVAVGSQWEVMHGASGIAQVAATVFLAWALVLPSTGAPRPHAGAQVALAGVAAAICALVWIQVAPAPTSTLAPLDPATAPGLLVRLFLLLLALVVFVLLWNGARILGRRRRVPPDARRGSSSPMRSEAR